MINETYIIEVGNLCEVISECVVRIAVRRIFQLLTGVSYCRCQDVLRHQYSRIEVVSEGLNIEHSLHPLLARWDLEVIEFKCLLCC
jgi:hypothetical protein